MSRLFVFALAMLHLRLSGHIDWPLWVIASLFAFEIVWNAVLERRYVARMDALRTKLDAAKAARG